jgi:hypothetical protein
VSHTAALSERSVSSIHLHKLRRQDGPFVTSLRTFAQFTQKRPRLCECYAGVATHNRVVSASCAAVQRAQRNRVLSGGKRTYKAKSARESPILRP